MTSALTTTDHAAAIARAVAESTPAPFPSAADFDAFISAAQTAAGGLLAYIKHCDRMHFLCAGSNMHGFEGQKMLAEKMRATLCTAAADAQIAKAISATPKLEG
jgi:hypothetical protein